MVIMKNYKALIWTVLLFSVIGGLNVLSAPAATFCRVCDSHDPRALDDCRQTSNKQHTVCKDSCLTQFSMTSSGLRIRKSCTDKTTCISHWWLKSRSEPECQRDRLTSGTLSSGKECSICCSAARDSNIYCSDDLYPPSSSLVQYPDVTLPPASAVSMQALSTDSSSTDSPNTMQSSTRQQVLINMQNSMKYPTPMTCAYCPNIDQKSSSSCGASIRCHGDRPLCMTSFYDDGHLNLTEVKRCAAVSECWDLWHNTTRLKSDCMGDRDHDPYSWTGTKSGECHYCCYTPEGQTQDWCNKDMWPTKPRNLVDMFDYESRLSVPKTTAVTEKSTAAEKSPTPNSITEQTTPEPSTADQTNAQRVSTPPQTIQPNIMNQTDEITAPTSASAFENITATTESSIVASLVNQTGIDNPTPTVVSLNLTNQSSTNMTAGATTNSQDVASDSTLSWNENITATWSPPVDLNFTDAEVSRTVEFTTEKDDAITKPTTVGMSSPSGDVINGTQPLGLTTVSWALSASETSPGVSQENTTVSELLNTSDASTQTDYLSTTAADVKAFTTEADYLSTTADVEVFTTETTDSPPLASLPPQLRCEACDDFTGQGGDCWSGKIEFCPDDKGYCLNTVSFGSAADGSPSTTIMKKCASFLACQSSNINSADCYKDMSDVSTITPGTRCNFCCNETTPTGIPCNANVRPDKPINFLTNKPAVRRSCFQCGNQLTGEPCGPGDLLLGTSQPCPLDKQFCMNDIYDTSGGGRTIYKRCVDEVECRNKWFKESSDTNECADYDPRNSDSTDLTCHFCCTEDGCNRPTKPLENTLWTPFYTGP